MTPEQPEDLPEETEIPAKKESFFGKMYNKVQNIVALPPIDPEENDTRKSYHEMLAEQNKRAEKQKTFNRKQKGTTSSTGNALLDLLLLGTDSRRTQDRRGTFRGVDRRMDVNIKSIFTRLSELQTAVNGIAKDVNSILAISKQGLSSVGKFASNKVSPSDLKPQTMVLDNKEYLYYPGAPQNRQFFEKSAKGNAGRIASGKIQKKLKPLIKTETAEREPATPTPAQLSSEIVNTIEREQLKILEKILIERAPEQEKNITTIINRLVAKSKSGEVDNQEEVATLKKGLYEALKQILAENPDMLKCQGGGLSPLDFMGNRRGAGRMRRFPRTPSGTGAAGEAAKSSKGTLSKAAGKLGEWAAKFGGKSALKKLPFGIGLLAGLGYGGYRLMQGDTTGAALEVASGAASTVPGIGTAASVAIDAASAARDIKNTETPAVAPTPQTESGQTVRGTINRTSQPNQQTAVPVPQTATSTGDRIVEMNRTIQRTTTGTKEVERIVTRPIIRNVNNVLPMVTPDEKIKTTNPDNTFNRLVAQDFVHPTTYGNLNGG